MLLMTATPMSATKLIGIKVIDKDYVMLHFRDGEVHYRDKGTGQSAYLGHSFAEGDDTLVVFGEKLKPSLQKIHGRAAVHMGKVPNGVSEETRREHRLSQLKEQLNAAIDEQNFEKAAQLRDELRRLSAEGAQS